jgi:phosphoenolpyruvate carboxykinase (GTP)
MDLDGIESSVSPATLADLLAIDRESWRVELDDQEAFFRRFGDRMPAEIWRQHAAAKERLGLGN